ncbi:unnamed protein product [Sphagnum troendelagicum]|uniref:Uncharacterized protein n=1 Tax=Sphagnum troendelagicum TaxID=128251 RepID=A0ABP0UD03_9BRYO
MAGRRSPILAVGLSIVVVVFMLVLLAELYYLLCWRRRRLLLANPRVSQGMITPLPADHLDEDHLHVHAAARSSRLGQSAFIHPAAATICCNNLLDSRGVGYEQAELQQLVAEKLFPAAIVKLSTATTDDDTTTMKVSSQQAMSMCTTTHSSNLGLSFNLDMTTSSIQQLNTQLMALPRMLFTIKEEEDLETGILQSHAELPNKASAACNFKPPGITKSMQENSLQQPICTMKSIENSLQLTASNTIPTMTVVVSPPNTPFVSPPTSPLHNSPVAGSPSQQANNRQHPQLEVPICNSGFREGESAEIQLHHGDFLPSFDLEEQVPDSSYNFYHPLPPSETYHQHHAQEETYHSHHDVNRSSESAETGKQLQLNCSLTQALTDQEFKERFTVVMAAGNLADKLHSNDCFEEQLLVLPDAAVGVSSTLSQISSSHLLMQSFSPSLESFKTPLDSTPPLGFGVEIFSLDGNNGGCTPPPPPPVLLPPSKSLTFLYPSSPLVPIALSSSSPKSPSSNSSVSYYSSPTRSASLVNNMSSPRTSPVFSCTSSIELHSL